MSGVTPIGTSNPNEDGAGHEGNREPLGHDPDVANDAGGQSRAVIYSQRRDTDDSYETAGRKITGDIAFMRHAMWLDEGLRAIARRYKPVTPVELYHRQAWHRIRRIRRTTLPPAIRLLDFYYGPTLLEEHPVRVSLLPFYVDEAIDLDLRFTQPPSAEELEAAIDSVYGKGSERLIEYIENDDYLPLPNPIEAGDNGQAHWRAHIFGVLLQAQEGQTGRTLLDQTGLKKSRLPDRWPWPDYCGDVMVGRELYAVHLEPRWRHVVTFDFVGEGPQWRDPAFGPGFYGETSPTLITLLTHQQVPLEGQPVSIPEFHYITFLMQERLRDPGWTFHRYHPVIFFNFDGINVRITQAHFDGDYLRRPALPPSD